jgi:hypothetical protein
LRHGGRGLSLRSQGRAAEDGEGAGKQSKAESGSSETKTAQENNLLGAGKRKTRGSKTLYKRILEAAGKLGRDRFCNKGTASAVPTEAQQG